MGDDNQQTTTREELALAACRQLVADFEASSGGECYCDNVECAYHLAKKAIEHG